MSKARLVITAVIVEGRTVSEAARSYGVSRLWAYELVARYRAEGERALEPRSRRPRNSPRKLSYETVETILTQRRELLEQGLDAGAHTIAWHLEHHQGLKVSPATIWRHLRAAGAITEQPKKRSKSSYIRFQADQPNETWQSDMTHWRLADRANVEILTFLDDHARYALSVTAHDRVTTPIVVTQFTRTAETHGIPASVLTDNGLIFTTRFAGPGGGRNRFETLNHPYHYADNDPINKIDPTGLTPIADSTFDLYPGLLALGTVARATIPLAPPCCQPSRGSAHLWHSPRDRHGVDARTVRRHRAGKRQTRREELSQRSEHPASAPVR